MVVARFIIILLFTIFVGLPLLIMEFTVGKMGRTYTTQIYSKLTGKMVEFDWLERKFSSVCAIWLL